MAPMCFDPFAKLLGFKHGMTFYKDYLMFSKFIEDSERKYGATQDMSIFWHQVSREIYYSDTFVKLLKIAMLSVNVWFFFIRKFCVPKCILNLLTCNESKWDRTQKLRISD